MKHILDGLSSGWNVICEKPLVLNPVNLEPIEKLVASSTLEVSCLLQLRYHPAILELKENVAKMRAEDPSKRFSISAIHFTRGDWYFKSWKGDVTKSGGCSLISGYFLICFFGFLVTWWKVI